MTPSGRCASTGTPDVAQADDGGREAQTACAALGRDRRLEGVVGRVHPDPEDVQLALGQAQVQVAGDGVDLHGRDEVQAFGQRVRARGGQLAVRGEVVVVGDGEQPDAGGVRLAEELGGFQDAIGAKRVGVDVREPRRRGRPARSRTPPRVAPGHR